MHAFTRCAENKERAFQKIGNRCYMLISYRCIKSIPREMIVKSLKKCRISNAMNDTDNDFIYESDDKNLSHPESDFYDEKVMKRAFIKILGDLNSDSEFVKFV